MLFGFVILGKQAPDKEKDYDQIKRFVRAH